MLIPLILIQSICAFIIVVANSDPEPPALVPVEELVKQHGYDIEKHEVKTEDGYILTLHRIHKAGPPVLLMHGIMCTSDIFCLFNYSIAYQLAENGNDIWLGNFRGNAYSRKHEKLSTEDSKFWDFSYQEMGLYDIPAMIDYITKNTKHKQIHYIGHSMGTTAFFVMADGKPEYNSKLKTFSGLAPVGVCTKYLFMLANKSSMYNMMMDTFKAMDEKNKFEAFPRKNVRKSDRQIQCEDYSEMIAPYCSMAMDMSKNLVGEYVPAGTALQNLKHYSQCYSTGVLAKYDYNDVEMNKKMYNSESPPVYDFSKVTVPTYFFYGLADQAVDESDLDALSSKISNIKLKMKFPNENFNHFDYVVKSASDIDENYNMLIDKLKEIVKN